MLPSDLPAPPSEATGFVEVTLETNDGTQLQPASIQLRLPVATSWRDAACPPRNCEILVWHYSDGIWTSLTAIEAGGAAGFTEYDVQAPSLSVFAIGTYKQEATMSAPMWQSWWPWILVGTVLASGGGAGWWALASRQRRNHYAALARVASKPHNGAQPIQGHAPEPSHDEEPPLPPRANADAKVSRLLKELKNNENLVQFVNNAAHDLANPLSPIQLQLHMLMSAANNKSDEKGKKSLEIVKRNVEQLAMLVTDLKDASRMQAGQMRLTPQPDDLGEIARKAVENFKEQAKGAEINLKFEGSQPLPVNADAGRLTQVLTNLINNALKFTPKGGSIRVMATQEETEALILVRDSGLGLTEDDRQRLFRPFSQVHGEQEKKKGTGLGLFISKGIIEGHGGTIGCESEGPGTGTTFWFSIPIRNAT